MFKHSFSPCQAVCNLFINHILLLAHTENRVMKGGERWGGVMEKECEKEKIITLSAWWLLLFLARISIEDLNAETDEHARGLTIMSLWLQEKSYFIKISIKFWIKYVYNQDAVTFTWSNNCHMYQCRDLIIHYSKRTRQEWPFLKQDGGSACCVWVSACLCVVLWGRPLTIS